MTYTETLGLSAFNWHNALDNPPRIGSQEHDNLSYKAKSWTTCACGNQCEVIPRDSKGVPTDFELASLGIRFSSQVRDGCWIDARRTLKLIEIRANYLITNEHNCNNT